MPNSNDSNENLYLPVILAVIFILLAAWLVWVTQVKIPQEKAVAERRATLEGQAVETTTESEAAPVSPQFDMNVVVAAANKGGCAACHVIPGIPNARGQVGPNLSNIGVEAATRREGYTAKEYIHESLAEPVAFTAPECPTGPCITGTMPPLQLTDDDIEVLVSYLSTLDESKVAQSEASTQEAAQPAPTAPEPVQVALAPIKQPVAPSDIVATFNKGGCAGCHTIPGIPGANGQVGPDLTEIGVHAGKRVSGQDAAAYLRESILNPNGYIAPECPVGACPDNVMLQTFAQSLTENDLKTIVGYLAVLGTADAVPLSEPSEAVVSIEVVLPAESVLEPVISLPKEPASKAQVVLGKYLFFDPRLSNNNSLSCASCHQPENAFADGQALSRGYPSTKYFRNTPSLYNTVYNSYLYRDGRMDGNDMPTLVRDHLTEAHFMSNDGRLMVERLNQIPAYVELFEEAFGGGPSFGRTLNAVTAYVQTLNTPITLYDQYLAGDTGALSEDAQAGLGLFEGKAGCGSCHSGEHLTDSNFYNIGVPTDPAMFDDPELHVTFRRFFRILGTPNYRNLREDVGQYALTLSQEDWGKFRTPGLREVGRTAPYMHNGSLTTLEDVVRFYNEGGGDGQSANLEPLGLTDEEILQLVAFLEKLSSEPVDVELPILPDYQLFTLGGDQ